MGCRRLRPVRKRAFFQSCGKKTGWPEERFERLVISFEGLLEAEHAAGAIIEIRAAIVEAIGDLPKSKRADDAEVGEAARLAARRWYHKTYDKKPVTKVHIIRV